jgi:hypothetical protein
MPAVCVDISLQLCISAETIHTASYASIRVQNMNLHPSLSPKHDKMPIRVNALSFDLCVLYYRSACTLWFPPL